jgi:hypothetical protein
MWVERREAGKDERSGTSTTHSHRYIALTRQYSFQPLSTLFQNHANPSHLANGALVVDLFPTSFSDVLSRVNLLDSALAKQRRRAGDIGRVYKQPNRRARPLGALFPPLCETEVLELEVLLTSTPGRRTRRRRTKQLRRRRTLCSEVLS